MDAVALWPVVLSAQGARRVQGRSKGSRVKLLFMVSWSSWYWRVRISFWSTLYTETMAASGRLGRAFAMRQSTEAFWSLSCPLRSLGSHVKSGAFFRLS